MARVLLAYVSKISPCFLTTTIKKTKNCSNSLSNHGVILFTSLPWWLSVKNLPAMQETWVWSLGWEDPLENGMTTHSSFIAQRILMDRRIWQAAVHGFTKSRTRWRDNTYREWINKDLLYSTESYSQYPMINHIGKECEKNVYMCVTESLCCAVEINTTLSINYTSVTQT